MPFGDRWAVERRERRISIHGSFEAAMSAVVDIARRSTAELEELPILIRDRHGLWREEVFCNDPYLLARRMAARGR
ncbi:MAG: hypothetical protein ACHP84_14490 [Caulobacterales bacterium]